MTAAGAALPALGYLGMAALLAHETAFAVRHAARCRTNKIGHRCSCWLGHRFLVGRPFHGYVVTDATYWRRADNTDGHVSPFQKLPGWQRRVLRTGPVLAVFGALVSWPLTLAALAGLGTGVGACVARRRVAGWAGRLIPQRLRERLGRHHGRRKHDLAGGLADITKTASVSVKPQIEWNPDYANAVPGDDVVTWYLPSGFRADPRQKAQVEDLFQGRVGFELVPRWQLDKMPPRVVFARARELPAIVYLHEVLDRVDALGDDRTAIGLDDQGNIVCWDWKLENPHGLVVAGSRHGKTELNRSITAQVVRKGGHVTGIDCKRISFQGLEGVPGFTLRNNPRDIRAMWEAIRDFYDEMERRAEIRETDPTAEFSRDLLIIEEFLQFSAMTDDWWEELEVEDPRDEGTLFWKPKRGKKTPRVWRWIKSLCWEGAEFGMHVIVDGQDGEFQALKGVRNVLGMRLLGGFQPNQWKNCVGTTPVPEAPKAKGRFCLVSGGQTWVQAICAAIDKNESAAIWRDYARNGRRMDGTLPAVTSMPVTWHVDSNGQVSGLRDSAPEHATEMGLSDIVAARLVRGTLKALRMDRHRSDIGELPEGLRFPEPVRTEGQKELFDVAAVQAFDEQRRGAGKAALCP